MKKYLTFIAVFILIASISFYNRTEIANAIGSIIRSGINVPNGSLKMRTSISTTTPDFIIAGNSTSTLTFSSEGLSSAGIELQVFASSSATNSKVQVELLESDDNINFFNYQVASSSNLLFYKPTAGATSTTFFDLGLLPSRYTKINIGVSTTTSGATATNDRMNVWANIVGNIK